MIGSLLETEWMLDTTCLWRRGNTVHSQQSINALYQTAYICAAWWL